MDPILPPSTIQAHVKKYLFSCLFYEVISNLKPNSQTVQREPRKAKPFKTHHHVVVWNAALRWLSAKCPARVLKWCDKYGSDPVWVYLCLFRPTAKGSISTKEKMKGHRNLASFCHQYDWHQHHPAGWASHSSGLQHHLGLVAICQFATWGIAGIYVPSTTIENIILVVLGHHCPLLVMWALGGGCHGFTNSGVFVTGAKLVTSSIAWPLLTLASMSSGRWWLPWLCWGVLVLQGRLHCTAMCCTSASDCSPSTNWALSSWKGTPGDKSPECLSLLFSLNTTLWAIMLPESACKGWVS